MISELEPGIPIPKKSQPKWLGNLCHTHMSDHDAQIAIFVNALFNTIGITSELMLLREIPGIPNWPFVGSAAVGVMISAIICLKRKSITRRMITILFFLNGFAVVFALAMAHANYGVVNRLYWTPSFQETKLGSLFCGATAPAFSVGAVLILTFVGVAVIQILLYPPELRMAIGRFEPIATLMFGLAAILILFHRHRKRQLEQSMLSYEASAKAACEIAGTYKHLRDLMNTPLQIIEFSLAMLKEKSTESGQTIERLHRALEELRQTNKILTHVDQKIIEDGSFPDQSPPKKNGN